MWFSRNPEDVYNKGTKVKMTGGFREWWNRWKKERKKERKKEMVKICNRERQKYED